MSVYTTLTLKEVQDFAAPYGLKVIDLIPIQGGIQNTNYFLVCEDQQYVLTVFEDMDEQAAGELVPVLEHLVTPGWPFQCLYPIQAKPFTVLKINRHRLHHA